MKFFKIKFLFCTSLLAILVSGCSISDLQEPLKCESPVVKDTVIKLLKEYYYSDEHKNSYMIEHRQTIPPNLILIHPFATKYDDSIKKYSCQATFILTSDNGTSGKYSYYEYDKYDNDYSVQKTDEGTIIRAYVNSPLWEDVHLYENTTVIDY